MGSTWTVENKYMLFGIHFAGVKLIGEIVYRLYLCNIFHSILNLD